ncbi:MAG: Brp/Blh family beta-carotene 15,15'-monooxygenase [Bacteroidia bacterium]|jgi:Brp/Blh family beta-carotene 15,15'-monooxygenase
METFFETAFPKVNFFYPRTRALIVITALLLISGILPSFLVHAICVFLIVTIGLMHGATDHILYTTSSESGFKTKIPKEFFIKYISILLVMGLVWLFLPKIALLSFLIVSGYHFGQTQLQYLEISEKSILKKVLYTIWGLLVLSFIILFNYEESQKLILSAVPSLHLAINEQTIYLSLLGISIALFLSALSIRKILSIKIITFEVIELLIIAIVSHQANLLISFGVFFSLWHSLRASQIQLDKISTQIPFSVKTFIKEGLPFTIISILGITFMALLAFYFQSSIKVEMLFLVAISMLTLPHIVIYEQFYNFFDRKKASSISA